MSLNAEALKEAALYYARERGWAIFPTHGVTAEGACTCPRGKSCGNLGKHPRTENGYKDATDDLATIEAWWEKWPGSNIGMPTGPMNGILVIDADEKTKGALEALEDLALDEAPRVKTGGGGYHAYLSYPEGYEVKSNAKKFRGSLDVRGRGGYVVLPPSNHASGRHYSWERKGPLPKVPDWLADEFREEDRDREKLVVAESIPEGQRDNTMFKLAASFRATGLEEHEIYEALKAVNANRCDPPMTDEEIRAKAKSAAKYPPGELTGRSGKAGRPPAPEFPLDALPVSVRRFCMEAARYLSAPVDFVAVPTLGVLGSAIGNSRHIQPKAGWTEPPAFYAATVADPGDSKTPGLSLAMDPAKKAQTRAKAEYEIAKGEYERQLNDREIKGEPKKPTMETVFAADITVEALASVLSENPRGAIVYRDEYEGWVASLNQYKAGGKGADAHVYKEAWSGGIIRVDRKTADEPLIVPNACVSVVGGIQPAALSSLGGDRADGFQERILLAYPDPHKSRLTDDEISPGAFAGYRTLYERLRALQPQRSPLAGTREFNESIGSPNPPEIVKFTPEAWEAFKDEVNRLKAEKDTPGFPLALKGAWAKLVSYLARFALVLALCRVVEGEQEVNSKPAPVHPPVHPGIPLENAENSPQESSGEQVNRYARYPQVSKTTGAIILPLDVTNATKLIKYFKGMARKVHAETLPHRGPQGGETGLAAALVDFLEARGGSFKGKITELQEFLRPAGVPIPNAPAAFGKELRKVCEQTPGLSLDEGREKREGKAHRYVRLLFTRSPVHPDPKIPHRNGENPGEQEANRKALPVHPPAADAPDEENDSLDIDHDWGEE